jgi:hypothetical protein|tara:strand:- start:10339 stop:10527 length:189 start_codon:yes stop_codon:yes gene_type:complete
MMGKSSLGIALVVGKNLIPNLVTGKTAFQTFDFILINHFLGEVTLLKNSIRFYIFHNNYHTY